MTAISLGGRYWHSPTRATSRKMDNDDSDDEDVYLAVTVAEQAVENSSAFLLILRPWLVPVSADPSAELMTRGAR